MIFNMLLCIIIYCLGYIEISTSQKEEQLGNFKNYSCPPKSKSAQCHSQDEFEISLLTEKGLYILFKICNV